MKKNFSMKETGIQNLDEKGKNVNLLAGELKSKDICPEMMTKIDILKQYISHFHDILLSQ